MPPQHILRQGQTASENLSSSPASSVRSRAGPPAWRCSSFSPPQRLAAPQPEAGPARPAPPPDAEGASGEAAAPPCGGYQQSSPAAREQNGARSRRLQGARRGGKNNCRETDPSLPPTTARRALRAARKPPAAHHRTARRGVSVCRRGLPHPSPAALGAAIFPLPLPPPLPATAPLLPSGQRRASGRAATDLHRRALRSPAPRATSKDLTRPRLNRSIRLPSAATRPQPPLPEPSSPVAALPRAERPNSRSASRARADRAQLRSSLNPQTRKNALPARSREQHPLKIEPRAAPHTYHVLHGGGPCPAQRTALSNGCRSCYVI